MEQRLGCTEAAGKVDLTQIDLSLMPESLS